MSAGHGHAHVRLGERDYDKALHDPRLQTLIAREFSVNYDYDIPYLSGYNKAGSVIYVDKDTPGQIKRGNRVYPFRPDGLVRALIVHEHWEKSALTAYNWTYAPAHELATHAEHHYVRDVLHIDPEEYEEAIAPLISMAEKKLHAQAAKLPPDLDRTPYT
jgi:hypothetical protein